MLDDMVPDDMVLNDMVLGIRAPGGICAGWADSSIAGHRPLVAWAVGGAHHATGTGATDLTPPTSLHRDHSTGISRRTWVPPPSPAPKKRRPPSSDSTKVCTIESPRLVEVTGSNPGGSP